MSFVYYQKDKNGHHPNTLFPNLEKTAGLYKCQNYNPLYSSIFEMNSENQKVLFLNHAYHLYLLTAKLSDNTFSAEVTDSNGACSSRQVFMKYSPLLDPYKYLIGKYDKNLDLSTEIPLFGATVETKIHRQNNSSYIDAFFSYLTSQLLHQRGFIHGIEFYGSFVGIKENFKLNIYDDIDYIENYKFFVDNLNKCFFIEDHYLQKFNITPTLLPKIEISDEPIELEFDTFDEEAYPVDCLAETVANMDIDDADADDSDADADADADSDADADADSDESNADSNPESGVNPLDCESTGSVWEDMSESDDLSADDDDSADDDSADDDSVIDDVDADEELPVTIPYFPVQAICTEKCDDTLDNYIIQNKIDVSEWKSILMQVIMILISYNEMLGFFTHNDLHTSNIMYVHTDIEYLVYHFANQVYTVPTYGKIYKIIDFGRAIYSVNIGGVKHIFCSDSFHYDGDATGQYNCEPYFDEKKPFMPPNQSFDLCRLGCSLFDFFFDETFCDYAEVCNQNPVAKIIGEWCCDDEGKNVIYKKNGDERYPGFKLYKMIARTVHRHTPVAQLQRPEFAEFLTPQTAGKCHTSGKCHTMFIASTGSGI